MSYSKYYVYKEQTSTDGGASWQYTGNETPSGESIGTYSTLQECEGSGPTPPGPTPPIDGKWKATYTGGSITTKACDSTYRITQNEINDSNLVSVQIGDCVSTIDEYTFFNLPNLTSVVFNDGCQITTISSRCFAACQALTSINIPSGVTSIGPWAFNQCNSLTSIYLPSGVTRIDNSAFKNNTSLANINIPSGVTYIGDNAFESCKFISLIVPASVRNIGEYAFAGCSRMTSFTCLATTPPTLGKDEWGVYGTFYDCNPNLVIYVPAASVSSYKSKAGWSQYSSRIQAIS